MISPSELDAAILAQAHKAVQAKPQAVNPPTHLTLRLGAPIASAALVVLSVTVFILMPELEQQQTWQDPVASVPFDSIEEESQIDFYQALPVLDLEADIAKHDVAIKSKERVASQAVLENKIQAKQKSVKASVEKRINKAMASKPMLDQELEEERTVSIEEAVVLSPELWSKDILMLIEQGDWLNADKQYAAFAKHYPEHEFNKEYAKLKQE